MRLPTGNVTFLFTDVAGSTQLWEARPEAMRAALPRHDALADQIARDHDGAVVRSRGEGDSLFIVFSHAPHAVSAAAALQGAFVREPWPEGIRLRVRMALHTGEADLRAGDYYGSDVNRAARLRALAHPEQVLVSQSTHDLAAQEPPPGCAFLPLGEHYLKDLDRAETVYQLLHPDLPHQFPELRAHGGLPGNLPASLTSFVGRQREVEEVKRRLEKSRLVTLTGSGGCGKSRLALHVTAHLRPRFPDGCWLAELASVNDPLLVPDVVREAMGFPDPGEDDLGTLVEGLRARTALLLLDGAEHLIEPCARLCSRLLASCPDLSIVVTSRQALGVVGEATYRVPSLSFPDERSPITAAAVQDCEAIQLFVERARAHWPELTITDRNAPTLSAICRRLDGIPLAIELAAARVRTLSLEELNDRLDERFRLLGSDGGAAIPRQRTLEALFDWSYALLTPDERALFERLSIFVGGWTLDAAEEICADPQGKPLARGQIADLLTSLVDKSLVNVESSEGETRFALLETVREFARARGEAQGESLALLRRHREYYLKYGLRKGAGLFGDVKGGVRLLQREQGNIRQALSALVEDPEGVESGLRLVPSLVGHWTSQAKLKEGGRFIAGLLARTGPETDSGLVSQARQALGRFIAPETPAPVRTEPPPLPPEARVPPRPAERLLDAKSAAYETGDALKAALCAYVMADARLRRGDLAGAHEGFLEAVAGFRRAGDDRWLASTHERMGQLALSRGDLQLARVHAHAALMLYRRLGGVDVSDGLARLAGLIDRISASSAEGL